MQLQPSLYPQFSPAVLDAMGKELDAYFSHMQLAFGGVTREIEFSNLTGNVSCGHINVNITNVYSQRHVSFGYGDSVYVTVSTRMVGTWLYLSLRYHDNRNELVEVLYDTASPYTEHGTADWRANGRIRLDDTATLGILTQVASMLTSRRQKT